MEPSGETNELTSTIVAELLVAVYENHIVLLKPSNSPHAAGSTAGFAVMSVESYWVVPTDAAMAVDVSSPGTKQRLESLASRIAKDPAVGRISDYYTTGSRAFLSRDGHSTYLAVALRPHDDKAQQDADHNQDRQHNQHNLADPDE